jgi:hypothetical protein
MYHKHQINYYKECRYPKMVNQVPHAGQYIKVPLEIGFTQFLLINLEIWIFG